jgi:hypothetical protein
MLGSTVQQRAGTPHPTGRPGLLKVRRRLASPFHLESTRDFIEGALCEHGSSFDPQRGPVTDSQTSCRAYRQAGYQARSSARLFPKAPELDLINNYCSSASVWVRPTRQECGHSLGLWVGCRRTPVGALTTGSGKISFPLTWQVETGCMRETGGRTGALGLFHRFCPIDVIGSHTDKSMIYSLSA